MNDVKLCTSTIRADAGNEAYNKSFNMQLADLLMSLSRFCVWKNCFSMSQLNLTEDHIHSQCPRYRYYELGVRARNPLSTIHCSFSPQKVSSAPRLICLTSDASRG